MSCAFAHLFVIPAKAGIASSPLRSRRELSVRYAARVTFLLRGKRKVTKREGHPTWRLPPIHGRRVRESGPGFSIGQALLRCLNSGIHAVACPGEKESTSCRLPLRGLSTPPHRRTGARVEQRAILARTRCAHCEKSTRAQSPFLKHSTPHALHRLPIRLPRALRPLRAPGGELRGSELPDALQAMRSVMERELRRAGTADPDARTVVVSGSPDLNGRARGKPGH
jgi:hypothetical protein